MSNAAPTYTELLSRSADLGEVTEQAKEVKARAAHGERVKKWRAGATLGMDLVDDKGGAYLRLAGSTVDHGERVESSRGADCGTVDAVRAIKYVRSTKSLLALSGKPNYVPLARFALGSFQVYVIVYANGDIKAGCHFIQFAEIDAIGKLLGA